MSMGKFSELDCKLKQINYQPQRALAIFQEHFHWEKEETLSQYYEKICDEEEGAKGLLEYAIHTGNGELYDCVVSLLDPTIDFQIIKNACRSAIKAQSDLVKEAAKVYKICYEQSKELEENKVKLQTEEKKFQQLLSTVTELTFENNSLKNSPELRTQMETTAKMITELLEANDKILQENRTLKADNKKSVKPPISLRESLFNLFRRFVSLFGFGARDQTQLENQPSNKILRASSSVQVSIDALQKHQHFLSEEIATLEKKSSHPSAYRFLLLWNKRELQIKRDKKEGIAEVVRALQDEEKAASEIIQVAHHHHPYLFSGCLRRRTADLCQNVVKAEKLARQKKFN